MSVLLDTLNEIRETTIASHYEAALSELKTKIKADPSGTIFSIQDGCVSESVANEIARRLNAGKVPTTVSVVGMWSKQISLTIDFNVKEVPVVEHVVEQVVEEVKEVAQVVEEVKTIVEVVEQVLEPGSSTEAK